MSVITDAYYSLGSKINKAFNKDTELETEQGVVSEKFPELAVKLTNEDISKLTQEWLRKWKESEVFTEWDKKGDENENYWKGKQYVNERIGHKGDRGLIDNVIFESLETYLPQVTRRNPDPMVVLARTEGQDPENLQYAQDLQKELGEIAEELVLRLKLKKVARHWAIYLLGVGKVGWDLDKDIPAIQIVRPKKIILDPTATIDEDGYTGAYVGEHRSLSAATIIAILRKIGGEKGAENIIMDLAKDKSGNEALATKIGFIEWWTDEFMTWTIGKEVLLKKKNPHWNYTTQEEAPFNDAGEQEKDEEGNPLTTEVTGSNHFTSPKKPYIFLSVFNLGKQPVDETSLIGQNLSSQDLVNKRLRQIDKNADSMNGGMVVSGERSGLRKDQARKVTEALRAGGTVWIPTGAPSEAVQRMTASSLPADIFGQLVDTRNRIRDIFGTRGSNAAGLNSEKTVRGKLQNRSLDTDRIGGGFSEYLEQFADDTYNWFTQLLYVYDERYSTAEGKAKVKIDVKEGSLLPKDTLTLANQAIDLASQNKMSLVDLYKALDYPDPEKMASNVWLQENAPEVLFENDPRVKAVVEARQQAQGEPPKPPSESINFKDLPPEGKAQMAEQAGINLNPVEVVEDDIRQNTPAVPANTGVK